MIDMGYKGIFISDKAIEELNIPIDKELALKAKNHIKQDGVKEQERTCYILNKNFKQSEGIYLNPGQIADAIEKVLETKTKLRDEFKSGMLRCDCGTKLQFKSNLVICPKCKKEINAKKYGKKIKFPATMETAFKLYIKSLRKKQKEMENQNGN